jgi:hypothetical protein
MLVLCAVASAQTLRSENDPRNLSPSVGTGGPEGGPTGLFTIYDGQTLRRGEFTFSIAYSNFDRDPGNLDIVETPISFNIGLSDYIELFFKTTGYKGIKANSPLNLSGFYLPNSRVFFGNGLLGSPPAIILAPQGPNVGTIRGTAVFRPAFCPACAVGTANPTLAFLTGGQPFVQYPFTGGPGPNFAQGPGGVGTFFGFPGFNATLGPPIGGNNGAFGAAAAFPGIGSPLGSILPGVVLATSTLPPTLLSQSIIVPATYTTAPAYYPGAPFLNRLYGESSFTDFVVGGKIRFTEPDNPLGVGIVPFYRYWWDKGDDASGFNQMQRGAGPGGDIGDFGLVAFLDARLSRSVNVSVNGGYILNSNPKDPNGFVLLDRPDEVIAGIGFDFPINKWFQPIFELRSTQYVGGRTPNAFENSPVEFTAGTKIYPRRWWGLGLWYRRHINQQRENLFSGTAFNARVNQITNVNIDGTLFVIPATQVPATINEFPRGFQFSDDANGFGFQLFIGRRNARSPEYLPNQAPTVTLSASSTNIVLPCPPGQRAECTPGPSDSQQVQLTANATDPDGDTLLYSYNVSGGRITGEGPNVTWDLTGVQPGTYTANVEVDDGCGCISFSSVSVTVAECSRCVLPCPTVNVTCPDTVDEGQPATFTANVTGGDPNVAATYNWSVSAGTITSGQGTPSITVDTTGQGGQTITATVNVGGYPPECNTSASCSTTVNRIVVARLFDQYGNIAFNDEKARLDNYAIQLQNEPGAQGYIVVYGGRRGRANEAQARADRAKDYMVNTRGVDPGRIVTVDGGYREDLTVELWIVPTGATPPTASPTLQQSDVTIITGGTGRSRRRRR